jgi:3-isopropylmalate dehydrogenase
MTLYQVMRPRTFDVVVAENLAGDIISDLSAATVGGLGFAPSGDIGDEHGMFQPAHGSAPDIAGKGIANPIATILSAAMLLRWLGERRDDGAARKGADAIESAVTTTLSSGAATTPDARGTATTREAGRAVVEQVRRTLS